MRRWGISRPQWGFLHFATGGRANLIKIGEVTSLSGFARTNNAAEAVIEPGDYLRTLPDLARSLTAADGNLNALLPSALQTTDRQFSNNDALVAANGQRVFSPQATLGVSVIAAGLNRDNSADFQQIFLPLDTIRGRQLQHEKTRTLSLQSVYRYFPSDGWNLKINLAGNYLGDRPTTTTVSPRGRLLNRFTRRGYGSDLALTARRATSSATKFVTVAMTTSRQRLTADGLPTNDTTSVRGADSPLITQRSSYVANWRQQYALAPDKHRLLGYELRLNHHRQVFDGTPFHETSVLAGPSFALRDGKWDVQLYIPYTRFSRSGNNELIFTPEANIRVRIDRFRKLFARIGRSVVAAGSRQAYDSLALFAPYRDHPRRRIVYRDR